MTEADTLRLAYDKLLQDYELLRKRLEQSEAAYAQLMDQFKQMQRHRFGQRSERYKEVDERQLSLL